MSENVNVCEYIESKYVHVEADCFDLEQIMESGQCFRIYKLSLQEQEKLCKSKGLENCESMAWYRVMAADKKVFVCQNFFAAKRNTSSSGVITLIWILITAVMKRQLMRMTII